jgi:hypothetical protein
MTKSERSKFITEWNIKYPYDKVWRNKYKVAIFSSSHRDMSLFDILLDYEEDKLYEEAYENSKDKILKDEQSSITSLRDKDYIPGYGNWLASSEDSLSEQESEDLFNKLKFV